MNETRALDLNGGWEDIVNNAERHNARIRFDAKLQKMKRKKKIEKVINISLGAVLAATLGFTGLLNQMLAGCTSMGLLLIVCFMSGSIWGTHRA